MNKEEVKRNSKVFNYNKSTADEPINYGWAINETISWRQYLLYMKHDILLNSISIDRSGTTTVIYL